MIAVCQHSSELIDSIVWSRELNQRRFGMLIDDCIKPMPHLSSPQTSLFHFMEGLLENMFCLSKSFVVRVLYLLFEETFFSAILLPSYWRPVSISHDVIRLHAKLYAQADFAQK